jgi:hypothetical protein
MRSVWVPYLREEREGRGDLLAGFAPAIRERPEHRDLVVVFENFAHLERLGLPRSPDSLEGADDRFRPFIRAGPGQVALELRIVFAE